MDGLKKILLVEDEKDLAEVFSMRLEINGFNVVRAGDGEEALKKARDEKPDVILLDLMLPKINGYEVCQMIKFDDTMKKIPVIILSALHQQHERDRATQCGADAYFLKPVDLELVIMKIKSLTG